MRFTLQSPCLTYHHICHHSALEGVGDVGLALERMRKEHYLVREREQALRRDENGPAHEWWYRLGPRAYVE